MSEKWACRFCKQKLELQPTDRQRFCHQLPNPEPHELWVTWTICPNINCRKPVLTAKLFTTRDRPTDGKSAHQPVDYWTSYAGRDLYPLPPPVPELLREDYVEARKRWKALAKSQTAARMRTHPFQTNQMSRQRKRLVYWNYLKASSKNGTLPMRRRRSYTKQSKQSPRNKRD